jgi:hypothetical protein
VAVLVAVVVVMEQPEARALLGKAEMAALVPTLALMAVAVVVGQVQRVQMPVQMRGQAGAVRLGAMEQPTLAAVAVGEVTLEVKDQGAAAGAAMGAAPQAVAQPIRVVVVVVAAMALRMEAVGAPALSLFATQAQPPKALAAQSQRPVGIHITRLHHPVLSQRLRYKQYDTLCTNRRKQRRPASAGY